jgi:hypothetical protein
MKPALFLLLALLPACTVKPTIRSGQTVVTLGGSIFTKTTGETASYSGPLGNLNYSTATNDETVVPGKIVNYYGIKSAVNGATAALRTTESTKRILGAQQVSKEATRSAADVEKLRILNPVEIPVP